MKLRKYILKHDTPEIEKGAIVVMNYDTDRYEVINLDEVARYPLTDLSYFSFHKIVVEESKYWFERI